MELLCHADVIDYEVDMVFGGLTRKTASREKGAKAKTAVWVGGGMGREAGFSAALLTMRP